MKKWITMFLMLPLIIGCAEQGSEESMQTATVATVDDAEGAATTELPPAIPDGYYEYLYCKNGANYSQDNFQAMLVDWNAIIDSLDAQPTAAFGYIPRGWETENFDGLWVLRWADKTAMEAGWAAYAANDSESKLNAKHPDVLTCGAASGVDRFGWTAYVPHEIPETFDPRQSPYYLTNELCTFNEGKTGQDLRRVVRGQFLPAVEAIAAANPKTTYWFRIEARDFEPAEGTAVDTNWINFWQTAEEGEASAQNFQASAEGQAIRSAFDEVSSCQPIQPWDGWLLRAPAAAE